MKEKILKIKEMLWKRILELISFRHLLPNLQYITVHHINYFLRIIVFLEIPENKNYFL